MSKPLAYNVLAVYVVYRKVRRIELEAHAKHYDVLADEAYGHEQIVNAQIYRRMAALFRADAKELTSESLGASNPNKSSQVSELPVGP